MERRLNDTDWPQPMSNGIKSNITCSTVSEPKSRLDRNNEDGVQPRPNEKDRLIRDLESEVEQQRQLRLADAKQVEAKAARIKVCQHVRHVILRRINQINRDISNTQVIKLCIFTIVSRIGSQTS